MKNLPEHKHEQLKANFDAFADELDLLMSKHNLEGLRIQSIQFADDAHPQIPCIAPKSWHRICDLNGHCTWVCR